MKMPKMILFDYGDTLLLEPDYNSLRGTKALMRYMIKNPLNLSAIEVRNIIKNDIDSESINFDCLVINDWQQLITVLNTMHFGNKDDYL